MYFLYSLLLIVGFLILLPRFLYDALRHGKYVAGFRERLGSIPPIKSEGRPVVWLHCVSVGESQAARPLVQGIRKRFPNHIIVVSTITLAGQNLARELFKDEAASVFYFPFDWRWTVSRALDAVRPSTVLLMETELWPGFLRECGRRQIPAVIVNGRLSQKSFRRYRWIKGFVAQVLGNLSYAVMQTQDDAERICSLGLSRSNVAVSGSLKFDSVTMSSANSSQIELRDRFNLGNKTSLILAASTHSPEENIILDALRSSRTNFSPKLRLIVAPRHPERFAEVAALLEASGFSWTSRTKPSAPGDPECDVILLDTIGELHAIYSLASIVFVGGSISNNGGHNILEPAADGVAIITGAHTHNFSLIVDSFVKEQALIQLPPVATSDASGELSKAIIDLLKDDQRRLEMGQQAKSLVERNRGATERTLDLLGLILRGSRAGNSPPNSGK